MLRPNFENTFTYISSKILEKDNFDKNCTANPSYYPFIMLCIVSDLITGNTDTDSMNKNLDFLLKQWH